MLTIEEQRVTGRFFCTTWTTHGKHTSQERVSESPRKRLNSASLWFGDMGQDQPVIPHSVGSGPMSPWQPPSTGGRGSRGRMKSSKGKNMRSKSRWYHGLRRCWSGLYFQSCRPTVIYLQRNPPIIVTRHCSEKKITESFCQVRAPRSRKEHSSGKQKRKKEGKVSGDLSTPGMR